jgi:signal transduction histidine kinase
VRLAEFIPEQMEAILAQWESFARTLLPAARGMTSLALRDHARQILEAVVLDLSTTQTRSEQHQKGLGLGPRLSAAHTAAETHAILRARSGFDINELAAEYRALRASVLRKWMDASPSTIDLEDVIRFNEAIDQALAESIGLFNREVEQSRNLLLGMLGHDMRSPLQTIQMTAHHLAALNAGQEVTGAAGRLIRSGARMRGLLDDLSDYTRTKFGLGINIVPDSMDLNDVLSGLADQLRAAHPGRILQLDIEGDLRGDWDRARLEQVLTNLIVNAFRYGAHDSPVILKAASGVEEVTLEVKNSGNVIEADTLERMFDPFTRGNPEGDGDKSLGLGLYIVREIVIGHGGTIIVESNAVDGTRFVLRFPRKRRADVVAVRD